MRRLAVLAQVDPLGQASDGVDPLHWLPAWRWTRVNDIWSHRGGGLFSAIKNAALGVLDMAVNGGFFLASLIWEVTTTMLSWALTPQLFTAFERVVDDTGLKLLDALGLTGVVSGASVFAAILLMAVTVAAVRFARSPVEGVKTLLRSFVPLAMCAVLVGTTIAEINNAAYAGRTGVAASTVPGSLKWMYRTLDNGRSLLVEGVTGSASLFSSVGEPPGTVYGCDSYLRALEDLYRKDAEADKWRGAQIETPIVVSRMWQAVYLDQFAAAQVGIHSSRRAGCWTAEVREKSVAPIEIFAVWDHTCTLDAEHHLYGCNPNRVYDAAQIQRAEAVFAPSDFDDHEWRSALTLWAVCDWRGRPPTAAVSGRNDLTPGAQRTLTEMTNMRGGVVYDGRALAMLASSSGRDAIFDPAFVGLRNARDSDKYLSAETCETYRIGQGGTANADRDGAWGLWAKWVTDRANIEPDDGADSRRHALGMSSGDAPDPQDREIQKDTVDSINGAGWAGRLMYSAVTVITAALYGFSLAGMGLGTLIAQFIVGGIVAVLPLLLVLMALPVKAAQQLPRKVAKLLIGALFAHLIFLFILSLVIMCIGILNQVLGGLTGSSFVRSMLYATAPLVALFAVNAITKQFGIKIVSPKGAALVTTGIALAGMKAPSVPLSQYAGRTRSRYGQISDRADVNREIERLEARSGESGVRTQPRTRPPDSGQPKLALNSESSPAAIAAGALATMGGRLPRGSGRGPRTTTGGPDPSAAPTTGAPPDGDAGPTDSGDAPTAVVPPKRPTEPEGLPGPATDIGPPPEPPAHWDADMAGPGARTESQHVDPSDAGPAPSKRQRFTEPIEAAAVQAGRAAKNAQWGALKAGRWARDHRRAIKRVAVGSIVAMGAVGMSAAAAPLAVGYAGAKLIGWRYRRQLQRVHLVRPPEERAVEKVERRQHRQTKRQEREVRVEQRLRRRPGEGSAATAQPTASAGQPSASSRPPMPVVAPRYHRPPVVPPDQGAPPAPPPAPSELRIPDFQVPGAKSPPGSPAPPASADPVPAPHAGSPTEMTAAQAGYLANLSESAGLDPSAVFEAVGGHRVRASEAIDVLRGGAPPDGAEGTFMDRVTDATSRVRPPPQPPPSSNPPSG